MLTNGYILQNWAPMLEFRFTRSGSSQDYVRRIEHMYWTERLALMRRMNWIAINLWSSFLISFEIFRVLQHLRSAVCAYARVSIENVIINPTVRFQPTADDEETEFSMRVSIIEKFISRRRCMATQHAPKTANVCHLAMLRGQMARHLFSFRITKIIRISINEYRNIHLFKWQS